MLAKLRFVSFSVGVLLLEICLAGGQQALAQPANATADSASQARQHALQLAEAAVKELQGIELKIGAEPTPCKLLAEPTLRWSNPQDGEVYGVVHFWLDAGRPVATTSVYQMFDKRNYRHMELVALTDTPLSAATEGGMIWQPKEVNVKFLPLPEAPEAASTERARRLQMRSLARKFSAEMASRYDSEDFSSLRLMSKPLLQYTTTEETPAEGAVFAMVSTTDPEILLLLESHGTGKAREWRYAVARMHFARLRMSYEDETIWEAPQIAPPWDHFRTPTAPYRVRSWPGVQVDSK